MIKCGKCSAVLTGEDICVWDVDSSDQCEDGRFESPTYSMRIKCHSCGTELYRVEQANSDYYERRDQ